MGDCEEFFEGLEDPRTGNAKLHSLDEVLVIALCTVVCGGETCADMALFGRSKEDFLRQFLRLEHGIPSHDTFSRLFRLLDPARFHSWFIGFMKQFAEACQGVIAIDGKTMRRSFDRASAASPLHLVSAFAADQRLILGQIAVDDKSNEIIAVPKLLELLSLKGRTVTADAMSCQRKIAQQVIDQGGNYVLALKGNQETLHDDVRLFLDDPQTPLASAVETDKGHGRIEVRTASLSSDIAWLQESHDWPGLKAVGKITASREIGGRTSLETRCYLPRDLQHRRSQPLGHRESAALDARCRHGRGPGQKPQRQRTRKPRASAQTRPQPRQTRAFKRLNARKTQARRMG